ncbi:MAG TPA: Asp-tRNA(Asn)/Glu-tRNA(Gln) amidotransferase subunit GatB [Chloroflexi bacterium]|jgi:aspartyl-tRNA(Asn)/glutamyl-tRNA(Gln) amidotransferase subunit B|nr:Asp-tRNA(Asn)/Glu-tRNA(Gln) amidotransferase subunit GatB [Chloroflexota bacterium]
MAYEAIIGMEVHAQIITQSKMFCGCSADYAAAPPNTHVCPICLAMPGVLPVINHAAVEATILTGMALNCRIPEFTKFDRKNYPYPDLPKGYQISQFDYPLCVDGWMDVPTAEGGTRRIGIRRVHLEEDTAKLIHADGASLVDYNRSGVPLMEIVTEADMRSAEDAWHYLTRLRTILRYLGVSSGNMEEGAMRCEANVSVRPVGSEEFGTKVEIKNLNSFRSVRLAIAYEIERQSRLLDEGGRVYQVTMGWDEERLRTVFQRSKEGSADYRYFPEPDLPPLEFTPEDVDAIRARLPELPDAKRQRFMSEFGLRAEDAALLTEDRLVADYYEDAVRAAARGDAGVEPQMVANWMLGEVFRLLREAGGDISAVKMTPDALAELLGLVQKGVINATVGKEVLEEMFSTGESASAIVDRRGLKQISDEDALAQVVRDVLEANPKPVQQYLDGKEAVFGFLVGQAMRATRGQANVQVVRELLQTELDRLRG